MPYKMTKVILSNEYHTIKTVKFQSIASHIFFTVSEWECSHKQSLLEHSAGTNRYV